MNENVMHVLIAMISSLGGVGAWRFYEAKLKYRATQSANPQKANENFISDLQARVAKLEALLIESSEEKDKLRDSITSLSAEVSGLKVKIKFLESENTALKNQKSPRK